MADGVRGCSCLPLSLLWAGMAAVCNGLFAYGGIIPFCATFLTFIGFGSACSQRRGGVGVGWWWWWGAVGNAARCAPAFRANVRGRR